MRADLRYGSLCSGYSGLDLGIQSVLGGETTWFVEYDEAPSKILKHHWPNVPNYGDLTTLDWANLPSIDVLTAGFPCQPFSHAGRRKGANDERHLWPYIAQGISVIRPSLVVLENVRGLLSAQGEPDPEWVATLADKAGRWQRVITDVIEHKIRKARNRGQLNRLALLEADVVRLSEQRRAALDTVRRARARLVRAIGVVARDLANLGYRVWWVGLRAADVGAAHGRFRVFIFATPADAGNGLHGLNRGGVESAQTSRQRGDAGEHRGSADRGRGDAAPGDLTLLPTPAVNDMGEGKTVEHWDAWTATMQAKHGNGNGHGKSLAIEAQRLLPTPRATDGSKGGPNQRGSSGDLMLPSAVNLLQTPSVADAMGGHLSRSGARSDEPLLPGQAKAMHGQRWGEYAPAIARWEALTQPAPPPTETGPKGGPRLSAAFVEWLMGLPAGWITDPAIWEGMTPSAARNAQLKAGGNGVVPQQAAAATQWFLHQTRMEATA